MRLDLRGVLCVSCLLAAIPALVAAQEETKTKTKTKTKTTAETSSEQSQPEQPPAPAEKKVEATLPPPENKAPEKKAPTPEKAAKGKQKKSAQKSAAEKAKEARSRFAAAELNEVDADFAFQGEYFDFGPVPASLVQAERAGLQVVARGDGQFDGMLYRGGLPGAGWDRKTKEKLTGKRENSLVTLRCDRYDVTVDGNQATIRARTDSQFAVLSKFHRISPSQDATPTRGATVLFDGGSTDNLTNSQVTPNRLLGVGAVTKQPVGDFQLHLEFRTPYMPYATGQGRGNSGVYIQQRYEVQILDSFGLEGVDNECGGLYKQKRPDVNMCLPPLSWQTFDIFFTAARWAADGNKQANARISVFHNGEPVHQDYALVNKTGGGKVEGPEEFPILLQNHGNPVTFRNIWIVGSNTTNNSAPDDTANAWTAACDCQPEASFPTVRRSGLWRQSW